MYARLDETKVGTLFYTESEELPLQSYDLILTKRQVKNTHTHTYTHINTHTHTHTHTHPVCVPTAVAP